MAMLDVKATKELFSRVYNNKMINDEAKGIYDEKDIKELCTKVFGDGTVTPDPSLLHQFNNIVVQQADEIARPMATNLLTYFADFQPAKPGDLYSYTVPVKSKARVKWAALGTGVALTRVEGGKKTVAIPTQLQTGFYYEPLDMVQDTIKNFRNLVNDIANAKVRLYVTTITKLISSAVDSAKIPAANVKVGDGLNISDFNKVSSVIQRVGNGGKPLFVADTLLIDYFANQQASDTTAKVLLSENLKDELRTSLNITNIGRTTCANLVNPFVDEANTKVELPVNVGYFFSSATDVKPFKIVEYGPMKQATDQHPEDERIKIILKQEVAIELVVGQGIGYIKNNTTTL